MLKTRTGSHERRQAANLIDFDDRRIESRRRSDLPVHVERRRLSYQTRLHRRVAFKAPLSVEVDGRAYAGEAVDLSPVGILILSDAPFERGTALTLHFSFRYNACQVRIAGEVSLVRDRESGATEMKAVGIRFTDVPAFEEGLLASAIADIEANHPFCKMTQVDITLSEDVPVEQFDENMARSIAIANDRRNDRRAQAALSVQFCFRTAITRKKEFWMATTADISQKGLSVVAHGVFPKRGKPTVEITLSSTSAAIAARVTIAWRNDEQGSYGLILSEMNESDRAAWNALVQQSDALPPGRREPGRARNPVNYDPKYHDPDLEKRKNPRRLSDIMAVELSRQSKTARLVRSDCFPPGKADPATTARQLRAWVSLKTGARLKHIGFSSQDADGLQANVENFIGMAQVPIGVAGPLKIVGGFARGTFYVPMATTEGTLVASYTAGMQILSMAGGVSTSFLSDETHMSPIFRFQNVRACQIFVQWLDTHFDAVKQVAEKTTRHGKLIRLEPHIFDRNVAVKFCYTTGEASGINIIALATDAACRYIASVTRPDHYHVQGNFSAIKKVTAHNVIAGYGKSVIAEAILPADLLKQFWNVTPQAMLDYYHQSVLGTVHSGMVGFSGHAANAITAIFLACGQDVANVVESHVSVANYELTANGDLYVSVKIPNLILGTVGGGTGLATQKECLGMIGCDGRRGTAKRLAEIVAAAVLAGEVSICAGNAGGVFIDAFKEVRALQAVQNLKPARNLGSRRPPVAV